MELSLGEQISLRRGGVINVKGSAGRSTFYLPPGWWTSVCLKGGFFVSFLHGTPAAARLNPS